MKLNRRRLALGAVLLLVSGIPLIALFFNSPYRTVDISIKLHASDDLSITDAVDMLSEQIRLYPRVTRFRIGLTRGASEMPDGLAHYALLYNRKTRTATTLQEGFNGKMFTAGGVGAMTDETIHSWSKAPGKIPKVLRLP